MAERVEVREPFRDARQQHEADMMGMYLFLATEIMLFGGLFAAIAVIRLLHPDEFVQASRRMHVLIGATNTAVLLSSSLAVALAVQAARSGAARYATILLEAAAGMGLAFLCLKGVEYWQEYQAGLLPLPGVSPRFSSPIEHLFMNLYVVATGLHAVHVTIGVLLLAGLALRLHLRELRLPDRAVVVENCGLYWHLVDIIWIFLFPALYLAR